MHIFDKSGYDTLKTEVRNLMTDGQTDRRTDGQQQNNTSSKTLFLAEVNILGAKSAKSDNFSHWALVAPPFIWALWVVVE